MQINLQTQLQKIPTHSRTSSKYLKAQTNNKRNFKCFLTNHYLIEHVTTDCSIVVRSWQVQGVSYTMCSLSTGLNKILHHCCNVHVYALICLNTLFFLTVKHFGFYIISHTYKGCYLEFGIPVLLRGWVKIFIQGQ